MTISFDVVAVEAKESDCRRPSPRAQSRELAYTLVELLLTLVLLGVLTAIAAPVLMGALVKIKTNSAISDMRVIDFTIRRYITDNGMPPDSLAEIGFESITDPWGRSFYYNAHQGSGWQGRARKDRFLVPLNSDYDLYSAGPDGETRPPLANPKSHDDIIRASDGMYFGIASDF